MKIVEYVQADGKNSFGFWFARLKPQAAARIVVALARIEGGNLSNVKKVGGGVLEYRLDWGPGYRIYFGRDGDELIILLGGGTKRRQQADVEKAQRCWINYKNRKKER